MGEFKVMTTVTISEQRVSDLLCCGMESGGYSDFVIEGYECEEIAKSCTYPHIEVPFKDSAILMRDKYGDSKEVYMLDRAAIQRGLELMAKDNPYQFNEFINENEDAITGTLLLQYALLGEQVYG
jgi:hypothetical protein